MPQSPLINHAVFSWQRDYDGRKAIQATHPEPRRATACLRGCFRIREGGISTPLLFFFGVIENFTTLSDSETSETPLSKLQGS